MTIERFTHALNGCSPNPLANYLKALGILRIVAEQADLNAQAAWRGDVFHLSTRMDRADLRAFFLNDYRPTPVVAPWNGGSGFYPKDNQTAMKAICDGHAVRTSIYRETIAACRAVCLQLNLVEKPDGDQKERLLIACRGQLPDDALSWLDAAFVLTDSGPKYPPLLGTGGNDGRLEFTNNLMQRLLDIIDFETGDPTASAATWWEDAFFSSVWNDFQKDSILGQFDPGAVDRPVNPWDYVLMIEGALVFAAASTRRLEAAAKGTLSYPFCVRSAGVGYGSAATADEESSRAELWLPLWSRPCSFAEMEALFSEGRAEVSGRPAKNGIDFARAVSTLGTDRGISEFTRFGFHARNGLAYFAVPLGRFTVQPQPQVNLLAAPALDDWLERYRRSAASENAPSSAKRASRSLDAAILNLCQHKGPKWLQSVLAALGEAESQLASSAKWRTETYMKPVPLLPAQWLADCDDGSAEFRLAASLAGIHSRETGNLRQHLESVETGKNWVNWTDDASAACTNVWGHRNLEDNLIAVLQRRSIEAMRIGEKAGETLVYPGDSCCYATLDDVVRFIEYETDDVRIAALVRGLILLDWTAIRREKSRNLSPTCSDDRIPDALFAVLRICHSPYRIFDQYIRLEPGIARLAAAGRLGEAVQLAIRRIIGSNLAPAIRHATRNGTAARRLAAALLFPLNHPDLETLAQRVLTSEATAG